jgi:hypothetical protein
MRIRISLLLPAMLAVALPARAQLQIGLGAGASVPTDDFDNIADVGFHVTGLVTTLMPQSPLGFRGELSVTRFDVSSGGDVRLVNGTANLVLAPRAFMTAKPYFIGGVGAYNVDHPAINLGGGRRRAASSSTRLGVNAGFGLNFGLGTRRTFLEARWVSVNPGEGVKVTFVPVTFGITF